VTQALWERQRWGGGWELNSGGLKPSLNHLDCREALSGVRKCRFYAKVEVEMQHASWEAT